MIQTIPDFSSYIAERNHNFTGRQWVFTEIETWLANPDAPRYFIITGEPGIGKTAIAAKLTQIRDIAAIHFCIARDANTIDPLSFARSISGQLRTIDEFAKGILEEMGIHLEVHINIQENYGQVIGQQIENILVESNSASFAFNRTVIEPIKKLYKRGLNKQLVILVDAIDEAVQWSGSENIVDLIANTKGLPSQVRFIITSRPENTALRHFEQHNISYFVLNAERGENLLDIGEYIRGKLEASEALQARLAEKNMRPQTFIDQITTASQGNFLYLVWLLPAIEEGVQRSDSLEALPKGLDGIYREFLRTRTVGKDIRQWRTHYRPILGILAAAQAPFRAEQLAQFVEIGEQDMADCLMDLQQFLDPMLSGQEQYRLYHQSVADFLLDKEKASEFWIDSLDVHKQIVSFYLNKAHSCEEIDWRLIDDYGLFHLAYHLVGAERKEELRKLLFNFNWMQAKLNVTDVHFLINDYNFFPTDFPLEMIKGAIQLSANVLSKDKNQLAGQLLGRLLCFSESELQALLSQVSEYKEGIRLLPTTSSLQPPGGPLIRTLEGHKKSVYSVAVTPEGRDVISGSEDRTLKIWDLENGDEKATLKGHHGWVTAVAVTPDGNYVVSGSEDRTLKVWDLKTRDEKTTLRGHKGTVWAVAVTPNGKYAVSASLDKTLKVWDLEKGVERTTLRGHKGSVSGVAITPNGKYAVSASLDKTLKMWDIEKGVEKTTFGGHNDWLCAVAVTPNGKYAVSASLDGTRKVWDLEKSEEKVTLKEHDGLTYSLAFTPNGKHVISGYSTLKVWDLEKGEEKATLKGHDERVSTVAITPNGRYAISASDDGTLKVWDLEKEVGKPTLKGHKSTVSAIAVTSDGKYAVSASFDGTLKVWDLKKREEKITLKGHEGWVREVAVTHDGHYAVSASDDRTLKVWDLKTGEEKNTLKGHSTRVWAVAITSDGNYAVSAPEGETLKIWDLKKGVEKATLEGHDGRVFSVAVTPNGKYVISASDDRTLKIWDLEKGVEKATLTGHDDWMYAVSVTPDGNYAISASYDKTLKIWDLEKGVEKKTLKGHEGRVCAVAVAPNGKCAISASDDRTLKIWDLEKGVEKTTLKGHSDWVRTLVVTSDGKCAVSASRDKTLKVWDLEKKEIISEFTGDSSFESCDVSPHGELIVAGDASGRMHFLHLEKPDSDDLLR